MGGPNPFLGREEGGKIPFRKMEIVGVKSFSRKRRWPKYFSHTKGRGPTY